MRVVEPLSTLAVAELAGAGADWLSKAEQMNESEANEYLANLDRQTKERGYSYQNSFGTRKSCRIDIGLYQQE